jgi:ABC-2 type transport system permease protein
MSPRRVFEVFRTDLRFQVKRPLLWVLVLIVVLMAWGLSTGKVHVASGDTDVGGKKAWITSMFQQGTFTAVMVFSLYGFFVAVAAGMSILRDDELKVGEILHGTRLTSAEYVWGKFASVITVFGLVLLAEIGLRAGFNHLLVSAKAQEFIGPFSFWNYFFPVLLFGVPVILFVGGTSFLLGERTRRPILVFFLPIASLLVCLFFLWEWSPSWLDPRWNRLLMWIDPAGLRWMTETWTKVDRGVDFYNHQSIGVDTPFAVSRVAFALLGILSVAWSAVHLERTIRGRENVRSRARAAALARVAAESAVPRRDAGLASLGSLGMRMSPPGFLRSMLEVTRIEFRELRKSPGLYLFGPLILLQAIGYGITEVGFLDTEPLWTSGNLAVGMMNTLTLLLAFMLLFYTIESLERERSVGLAPIHRSTSTPTTAVLFGKAIANSLIGGVVVGLAFLGAAITLLIGGKAPVQIGPFFVTWGLLLVPTFVVWTAFVAAVHSISRNRYTSYAIGLGTLCLTAWFQTRGKMTWTWNWNLWSAVRNQWSDFGTFELLRHSLLLNRVLWLSAAVFFVVLAVRFYPRRELDASGVLAAMRPKPFFRNVLRLGAFAIVPVALGFWIQREVDKGFQGDQRKKLGKDYWAKNVETWKDAPKPSITDVVLDLELKPEQSWFKARGTYTLTNIHEKPLRQIALTPGPHFENRTWTIDGKETKPDDRAGLCVFDLPSPLEKDGRVALGFEHDGVFPKGSTKNGGGVDEYILPAGVVLTSFQPSFVPTIGFLDEVGVDEDNRTDPKVYPDDFYEGITQSAFGNDIPHTTHITLHAPEAYTLNASGALVSDEVEDGIRTSFWESDHPINFFNVVAGKWTVRKGEGTAIYYHAGHDFNIDEMSSCLDGARKHFSAWFREYPWKELKLSEFSGLATYAQGFATNITFSEGIGFLTKSEPESRLAFMVTAHETAHQWWGNILEPGKGPGGNVLSEGMAHFSTMLLIEEMLGPHDRIGLCKKFESRYGDRRQVDSERPLVKLTGTRDGDTTCTYDKGGWVAWMLLNHIGRENMLAGCREFIRRYEHGPDHPVLQDFVAVIREFAPDKDSYDAFVKQWFFEVVVPQYELADASKVHLVGGSDGAPEGEWEIRVKVKNAGTGRMPIEVAATRGERFPDAEKEKEKPSSSKREEREPVAEASVVQAAEPAAKLEAEAAPGAAPAKDKVYREARTTITLGAGESQEVVLRCPFDPEMIEIDPDALVLQLERKFAIFRF